MNDKWASSLLTAGLIRMSWIPDGDRTSTWEWSRFPLCLWLLWFWRWSWTLRVWRSEEIILMNNTCLYPSSYRVSAHQIETFSPMLAIKFETVANGEYYLYESGTRLKTSVHCSHGPQDWGQGTGRTANCRHLDETGCRVGHTNHHLFSQTNCWHLLTLLSHSL